MKRVIWPMLAYILLVSILVLKRYAEGIDSTFDLGIHDQACWLVYNGLNPFLNSRGLQVQADHFNPMAYLLAPLYFLWDDPRVLLIFQTLVLGSGAIPVYLIAQKRVKSSNLALMLACLYLCQPCLMFANFFDFHFTTLLSTPLLWACYGLEAKDWKIYFVALVTALLCSETAAMSMFGLALLVLLRHSWKQALATVLIALAGLTLALKWVSWHNQGAAIQYTNLYSHWGNNGKEVALNVMSHPWHTLTTLNTGQNREYLLQVFGPLAFTPVLALPELMPIAPVLAGNLLSWRESQHSIRFHYTAGILPFLLYATCIASARIEKRFGTRICGWLLVIACIIGLLVGPLHPEEWPPSMIERQQALAEIQHLIPGQASISVENCLGGPLSHRLQAYLFPNPFQKAAWGSRPQALVDQSCMGLDPISPGAWRRALSNQAVEYILAAPGNIGGFPFIPPDRSYYLGETCASPDYGLIYARNGAVVFAKTSTRHYPPRVLRPLSDWSIQREHLDNMKVPVNPGSW